AAEGEAHGVAVAHDERRAAGLGADVGDRRLDALGLLRERLAAGEAEARSAVDPALVQLGLRGLDLGHAAPGPIAAVGLASRASSRGSSPMRRPTARAVS